MLAWHCLSVYFFPPHLVKENGQNGETYVANKVLKRKIPKLRLTRPPPFLYVFRKLGLALFFLIDVISNPVNVREDTHYRTVLTDDTHYRTVLTDSTPFPNPP